jgi:hypothetical protein
MCRICVLMSQSAYDPNVQLAWRPARIQGPRDASPRELQDIGFTNVTAALVNFSEWTQKGYPVVKD